MTEPLSFQEQVVMDSLVAGKRSKEIAVKLDVTVATVSGYVTRARLKLGARTMAQACVIHDRSQRERAVDYKK